VPPAAERFAKFACAARGLSTAPGVFCVNDQALLVGESATESVPFAVMIGRAVLWDHRVRRQLGQAESPPLSCADRNHEA
jgi:hypothetical protein